LSGFHDFLEFIEVESHVFQVMLKRK
jgi:hypothetical protein